MYKLLYPECLGLLLLPFVLLLFPPLRWEHRSLRFPAACMVGAAVGARTTAGGKLLRLLKWIFLYLGWMAWCIVLCAPVYVPHPEKEIKEQRNILLATDISLSMDTRDWHDPEDGKPMSRWEAMKKMTTYFINARQGDRFAHVVFGQEAYLQVPFTQDAQVILQMQEKVRLGDAGPKTSIGNAIAVAIRHFDSDSITRKMMLLVTDGLDTQNGISPVQMAEEAAKDSVRIYTIAMGNPEEGFGNVDHGQLNQIASLTGGKSFRASSQEELQKIFNEIDATEPMEYVVQKELPVRPLYPYPLAVALVIFGIAVITNFIKDLR